MKVLVCEGDLGAAKLILDEMERQGYEVDLAFDEPEALRKVRTIYSEFVVLDGSGIGLAPLRALREAPWSADVPCAVLTASADVGDIVKAYEAGADMVLTKPFDPQELLAFRRRD